VALLGVADAAFLGGGGRLLLRLDGREPVELYGYQVAAEHLERLVKVMRTAYPAPVAAPAMGASQRAQAAAPPAAPQTTEHPPHLQPGASPAPTSQEPPPPSPRMNATSPVEPEVEEPCQPIIQLFCFGRPRVVCAGQQVWPRGGGDAKPWEFLLYLGCQPVDGVARSSVVEALWPEDELPDEGAHRFRQLRYRLRRQLQEVPGAPDGDGVCLGRRSLRLDPCLVYSDAQEFLTLVRSVRVNPGPDAVERLERARALYVGDLLEGPDTRRYAWVDERDGSGVTLREHFRRLFQNASVRLAELYTAAGALEPAIELYRELTDLDPADDRLWLALLRLHAQRGDRPALIAEERRLRETLRELAEEVDSASTPGADEPSREIVEEYQRLLAQLRDREPAAV
jgi:DNA-binding SARP family transcriptional activator